MKTLSTLVLLLLAAPAFAQEMPTAHKVGLSLYATSAALDYHSTYRVLASGGVEDNPLGKLTEGQPAMTVAVGAVTDAAVTVLLYKWLGKKHPALTTVLLVTASSVRLSLAAGNYHRIPGRR